MEAAGASGLAPPAEESTLGAHLLGTCRMGDDPRTSVVDRYHRAHDVPNLFICDGSSFVTSGRGQPTMTIMALAFRAPSTSRAPRAERNLNGRLNARASNRHGCMYGCGRHALITDPRWRPPVVQPAPAGSRRTSSSSATAGSCRAPSRRQHTVPVGPARPPRRARHPAETRATMENIKTLLEANGATMDDVVKCTVFLADFAEWGAMNEVYAPTSRSTARARSAVAVSGMAGDARVEIECMAVIGARHAASGTARDQG
jgi:hypothetical protein